MEFNPSEEGEKLEPNEDIYCEFCHRKKLGCNDTNWIRHKKACKAKEDKKVQSKRKGTFFNKKITKYFKTANERIGVNCDFRGFGVEVRAITVDDIGSNVDAVDVTTVGDEVKYDGEVSTDVKESADGGATNTVESGVSLRKCEGYRPNSIDIHRNIVFNQLKGLDIVIEDINLHHMSCRKKGYVVYKSTVNEACESLQYCSKLKEILERGKSVFLQDEKLNTTPNELLSRQQLIDEIAHVQKVIREIRLQLLNSNFKNSRLCGTIALHEGLWS